MGNERHTARHTSENTQFSAHEKTNAVLRVLKGESVEKICEELGVSLRRLERWKSDFVTAGAAELARRKDVPKKSWLGARFQAIEQWALFLMILVVVIGAMAYLQNRPTP